MQTATVESNSQGIVQRVRKTPARFRKEPNRTALRDLYDSDSIARQIMNYLTVNQASEILLSTVEEHLQLPHLAANPVYTKLDNGGLFVRIIGRFHVGQSRITQVDRQLLAEVIGKEEAMPVKKLKAVPKEASNKPVEPVKAPTPTPTTEEVRPHSTVIYLRPDWKIEIPADLTKEEKERFKTLIDLLVGG